MPKFMSGDIVRVRIDAPSPFKGHVGIIDFEPIDDLVQYMVKFESGQYSRHHLFAPQDLELIGDLSDVARL